MKAMNFMKLLKMRDIEIAALFFVASFIINIVSSVIEPVIWWDEGVYSGLGMNLASDPFDYSFKHFEDFSYDWPGKAGYKSPLLPYVLAGAYVLNIPVTIGVPLVAAIGVAALYLFVSRAINRKTGLWAAMFLMIMPLFAYFSGKMLTDAPAAAMGAILLLLFWRGFEEGDKRYKVASGVVLGLSVLTRLTFIWLPAILLAYMLVRHRNVKFLKDRWLWISLAACFMTLMPWLWYGFTEYGTPLGPLIHSGRAMYYWGGTQSATFYFDHWLESFAAVGIAAIFGAAIALRKRNPANLLLLFWFAGALAFSMLMPHKEMRFLLIGAPAIAGLAAVAIESVPRRQMLAGTIVLLLTAGTLMNQFWQAAVNADTPENACFLKAVDYLRTTESDATIYSRNSPVIYHYTHRESLPVGEIGNSAGMHAYYLWTRADIGTKADNIDDDSMLLWSCESAEIWKLNR
ncbi:MAG: glycosyltransferase family 39 protein [Candidatus Aenigmatarchaeota archaeon]